VCSELEAASLELLHKERIARAGARIGDHGHGQAIAIKKVKNAENADAITIFEGCVSKIVRMQ
jgi:hypothetical protein